MEFIFECLGAGVGVGLIMGAAYLISKTKTSLYIAFVLIFLSFSGSLASERFLFGIITLIWGFIFLKIFLSKVNKINSLLNINFTQMDSITLTNKQYPELTSSYEITINKVINVINTGYELEFIYTSVNDTKPITIGRVDLNTGAKIIFDGDNFFLSLLGCPVEVMFVMSKWIMAYKK